MYLQNRNILFYSRNFYFRLHNQYTIMDLKQVQELVKLVTKSGIAELKVKEGDFSITIKSVSNGTPMVHMPYQQVAPQAIADTAKKEETVVAVAATAAPGAGHRFAGAAAAGPEAAGPEERAAGSEAALAGAGRAAPPGHPRA